jgi:hypothetical protein
MIPLAAGLLVGALPAQAAWEQNNSYKVAQWGGRSSRVQDLERLAYHVGIFKQVYDRALDRSRLDGSNREDNLNERVQNFHDAARNIRNDFADGDRGRSRVRDLLEKGWRLDEILDRSPRKGVWENEWRAVRQDLRTIDDWGGGGRRRFY